jgi:hypothetical protein
MSTSPVRENTLGNAVRPREPASVSEHKYVPLALIWFAGIVARIPFYLAFRPTWSADSPGYVIPYFLWRNHRFFLGARTPVYPLFLGFAQWLANRPVNTTLPVSASYQTISLQSALPVSAAYLAVGLQSALDIAAAGILYFTMVKLNVRRNIALLSAVFVATVPALSLLDINILTLSLSYTVLAMCAWAFSALTKRVIDGSRFIGTSLLCGLIFACAVLLRPENLVFCTILTTVFLGSWAIPKLRGDAMAYGKRVPAAVFFIILSAAPPILAWMTWNYVGIGEFRVTTLTGWNRSKTVYNMFDRVGAEDRVLGEALVASYLRRNRDGKTVRDHAWQALKDSLWEQYAVLPLVDPTATPSRFHIGLDRVVEDVLGMKARIPCEVSDQLCTDLLRREIDIGDYVGKVSWKLIKSYPGAYLANVTGNFVETFDFRYLDSEPASEDSRLAAVDGRNYVRNKPIARLLPTAIHVYAPLLTAMYAVTFSFVVFAPLFFLRKNDAYLLADRIVTALAFATVGTFITMCCLSGYNKEYSIPHLGVMVICTAYAAENRSRIAAIMGPHSTKR